MSKEEKRRKKEEVEEALEGGRTYGTLSRTEPDIWDWIEKESTLTGRKKHDIIAEALGRLIIEREVIQKGLTMEQLLAAWDIKDRIENILVKKMMMVGTTLFGSLLQQAGELVTGIRAYQDEMIGKIVEEEKKKDIEFQIKRTQAQMAAKLMETMMPMIMATLSQIKIPGAPQITRQEEKKQQVEVEVIE